MPCRGEDFIETLMGRRSSKLLRPGYVPREVVIKALEAGVSAANAHNAQPWRFIVVDDKAVMEELLKEMERLWRRDLVDDGLDVEKVDKIVENAVGRSRRASLLLVACLTMEDMDKYRDSVRNHYEYIMAVQSVAAALQNILLALHAMGYGACWRCSALFAPEAVRKVLGLPEDLIPQALVEVGLKGGETKGVRRPLGEVVHHNRWGVAYC
ncbi:Coenzyme F420:L-glutamate ligase [archaeon HR01]|nr:Coenzyme F420:L-glutamate ligase [archaeon HR01]